MEQQSSSKIESLLAQSARLLENAKELLVITGAGISAESGIPTYRGPGGIYEDAPETQSMLSAEGLERNPDRLWEYFNELRTLVADARPNPAHLILAQWEKEKRFPKFLIATQNIDGLHQKAGSIRVSEIHGSIWQMACPRELDYTEDEQFSNEFSQIMSGGNNDALLKRWSEENDQTIWEDRNVPFSEIPPYHNSAIRPNILFFNETYGNRLLWVEDFIRNGVDTILIIGCSGGVAILDRLVRKCRKEKPDCNILNINPHQDTIEQTHHNIPLNAGAALEGILLNSEMA